MTTLQEIRDGAAACTRCDPYQRATQTVIGEGPTSAAIALVGEQPGDQEDKQGHPFVGPAGRVLDRALDEAGISRGDVYLTSAVLRGPDQESRDRAYAGLVADLATARGAAKGGRT